MSQVKDISKPEVKAEENKNITTLITVIEPDIKLIKNKTNLLGYNYETVLKTIFSIHD